MFGYMISHKVNGILISQLDKLTNEFQKGIKGWAVNLLSWLMNSRIQQKDEQLTWV